LSKNGAGPDDARVACRKNLLTPEMTRGAQSRAPFADAGSLDITMSADRLTNG